MSRYRLPAGVRFQRWRGEEDWVLYHSGTGETMRLSEAAVAVLDILAQAPDQDRRALGAALNALMDAPLTEVELDAALEGLLRELLNHECIESPACA